MPGDENGEARARILADALAAGDDDAFRAEFMKRAFLLPTGEILYPHTRIGDDGGFSLGWAVAEPGTPSFAAWERFTKPLPADAKNKAWAEKQLRTAPRNTVSVKTKMTTKEDAADESEPLE